MKHNKVVSTEEERKQHIINMMEGDEELGLYTELLEYGLMQHIKMCLECNNEASLLTLARYSFNAGRRFEKDAIEKGFVFEEWLENQLKKK